MTAREESRLKILEMLQEGKITAEDAARLIEALGQQETGSQSGQRPRWLRIRVTDTDTDMSRVNITLPIGMVRAGLKMGAHFGPDIEGLNMAELESFVQEGRKGHLIDVFDENDGEHVEIFLE